MNRKKIIINVFSLVLATISYFFLKKVSGFEDSQIKQKIFFLILFICGLFLVFNNYLFIRQKDQHFKIILILLLLVGVALTLYSGFVMYLFFAFRNGINF